MKEDHSVQLVTCNNGPPSPKHMLRFVIAVPSKLDAGLAISLRESAVHLATDATELKLAGVAAFELDERLEFFGFLLNVPVIHVFDDPSALKRIGGFCVCPLQAPLVG